MSSVWGERLKISLFGESRGEAVGVVIDGFPAGEPVDAEALHAFLRRRAPGRDECSSARNEADRPEILSGVVNGMSCGSPICVLIRSHDAASEAQDRERFVPRPGHADYPAFVKYGGAADLRGGGHFSGRLTAAICAAGGLCLPYLQRRGIQIAAHASSVAGIEDTPFDPLCSDAAVYRVLREQPYPVLSDEAKEKMLAAVRQAKADGDSFGGTVECLVTGLPVGLGGPLFGGLEPKLASILFAIPAVKGLSFGDGFALADLRGSEANDAYIRSGERIVTASNHAGGIVGGMSNGMPLLLKAAFKPTPSIARGQASVDLVRGEETMVRSGGRNDSCVVFRAVPVVEAAAALAVCDLLQEGRL
ncbi:MAG: chorismate synthase [Oscillospiraceae bacterium]|nr:chorismate synthase [Oscillospiraceae bacterium]